MHKQSFEAAVRKKNRDIKQIYLYIYINYVVNVVLQPKTWAESQKAK